MGPNLDINNYTTIVQLNGGNQALKIVWMGSMAVGN